MVRLFVMEIGRVPPKCCYLTIYYRTAERNEKEGRMDSVMDRSLRGTLWYFGREQHVR